ncbi:hypothetical protein RFI_20862 [Reticulomyxa filosa]|uniref:Cyclin-dependent kinase 2 homolog n=1 Tax=Reticulomyxa filosa TaxID=46433 RepID=X6MTP3_RETFI|nr:hypothetical protein RFI_20862 [Reticulomyxa filosa]|eukprot:ETO16475.1 hypothetical protein RFI_20862 [Reticulomyxa filosa]
MKSRQPLKTLDKNARPPAVSTNVCTLGDIDNFSSQDATKKQYKEIKSLGKGAYGRVSLSYDQINCQMVAIKMFTINQQRCGLDPTSIREIAFNKDEGKKYELERSLLLLRVYCDKQERNQIKLVFEHLHADLGFLLRWKKQEEQELPDATVQVNVKNIDREKNQSYTKQILEGVKYLHNRRVIHRDLKPQNILISADEKKLICISLFFGSIFFLFFINYTKVVTLWYRAPEILLGCTKYNEKVDLWSIAFLSFEILGLVILIYHYKKKNSIVDYCTTQICLFKKYYIIARFTGTPTEDTWPGVSKLPHWKNEFPKWNSKEIFSHEIFAQKKSINLQGLHLLQSLLQVAPFKRPSATQALAHAFFSPGTDTKTLSKQSDPDIESKIKKNEM